jgi:hypothetical protein
VDADKRGEKFMAAKRLKKRKKTEIHRICFVCFAPSAPLCGKKSVSISG